MNSVGKTRQNSGQLWHRVFPLAIVLLALGMAGQAVHAKASHYSGKSPQTVYFSSSVKIANLAHHYSATPKCQAIVPAVFAFREPRPTGIVSILDSRPVKLSRPISSRQLRSPPETR